MSARIRRKSQLSIAREGFLDRRSKRCFWLLLSPQTKVARAGARNYPRWRQIMRLRRCAATPHPPPSGAPVSLRVGRFADLTRHRRVIQRREPLKGKANGGVSFNAANPSRGRLTAAGGGRKKDRRGRSFCLLFGCTAYWDLLCSFWSMAVNSGGRGQWSSTGSPVRGWMKRRPAAWRHWPVRPGTGFLAP